MAANLRIDAVDYSGQEDPRFKITLLPAEPPQPVPTVAQESFCSFCLRERPLDGAFYGYNIENCPMLRETMVEIFGPKFKLEKFAICTPCWNMVQLLDDFRTCCFEASSRVERIQRGISSEDGWFTEETVKGIEIIHCNIRDQIELIRAFEEMGEPCAENDVVTIDDDSDSDGSTKDLVIDESMVKPELSNDDVEMVQETNQQPTLPDSLKNMVQETNQQPDSLKNIMVLMPVLVLQPTLVDTPGHAITEQHQPAVLNCLNDANVMLPPSEQASIENSAINNVVQSQENHVEAAPPEISTFHIKMEPEEPPENSEQFSIDDQQPPPLDQANNKSTDISIHNIKTVVIPPESDQISPPEQQQIHPAGGHDNENLFTEISVENVKVEQAGVAEKIAQLVNVRVNQCGRCGHSFSCASAVTKHLSVCKHQDTGADLDVAGGVMYTCQICWASYRSKTNFKAHINQHAGNKPYRCRLLCSKRFFGLKGRIKHEAKCNAGICCAVCDRNFSEKETLFAHIKSEHGKIAFSCEICDIEYHTKSGLRQHQRKLHTERKGGFMCRRCYTHRSNTAYDANLHLKDCMESFTYNCDQCDVKVQQPYLLRLHKEQFHEEQEFGCHFCDKKFKRRNGALKHERSHTRAPAQPTFGCSICPKLFKTNTNLRRHMKVHAPQRPYPCPTCPKSFCSKQALKIHIRGACSTATADV